MEVIGNTIIAENDDIVVDLGESSIITITENDVINGEPAILGTTVTITEVDNSNNGIVLDPETGIVTIDPNATAGDYVIEYTICSIVDPTLCDDAIATVVVPGNVLVTDDDIEVFTSFSPNGDGVNDTFAIQGLLNFPNNTVRIYNRWGVKVFDTRGYGQNDNVFRGFSNGRVTISDSDRLPTGTYYYVIEYTNDVTEVSKSKAGYIYIN